MGAATLALVGAVNAVTAASFAAVAWRLLHRPKGKHRMALHAIALWWSCMAVLIGLHAVETLGAAAGFLNVPLAMAMRIANGILLGAGAWGLCFHVLYLRSGSKRSAFPLGAFFAVVGTCYIIAFRLHPIVDLVAGDFEVEGIHRTPLDGSLIWTLTLAGVGLPLIAASVGYLLLSRRLQRPDQKRRAVLASSGILAWVGAGLVAQAVGGPLADVFTYTILGLLTAVLVFLAYFPRRLRGVRDAEADPIEVAPQVVGELRL